MEFKFESLPKSLQRLWVSAKFTWKFFIGLPAFLALLNFLIFGVAKNSSILNPILQPRPKCSVVSTEPEGKNIMTTLIVKIREPLYLKVLSPKFSMLYMATLNSTDGFSFFKVSNASEHSGPTSFDKLYDSTPQISKVITYKHRIVSNEGYSLNLIVSGPYKPVEEECPFDFYVRY